MGDRRASAGDHGKLKRKDSVKPYSKTSRSSDVYPERFELEKQYTFSGYNLKITQTSDIDLHTSAVVWDADILLCEYFEKMDISFFGKKVIELCSGTGIVGILAVLFGGEVTLTDRPAILKQMEHNVSVNIPTYLAHRAIITDFTWRIEDGHFPSDFDFILGSDIAYNRANFPQLLTTLLNLSNESTIIYLTSEMRSELGTYEFYNEMLPRYFHCNIVQRCVDTNINVYKITRKESRARELMM